MTIPNRTVSITGIFAEDASTTIPLNPVPGASYRDTTMTGTVVREGWAFKTIVDSSKFNQAMYEYSSVTAQIEKYGFLPWSNLTDYVQGSLCLGSNGVIYQAKQATGPSTTAVDPTTDSSVWQQIILGNTNSLFDHKWEDYQLNRMDWLRADTFSWQDGTVYSEAYNHLVADYNGGTSQTETVGSYTITYVLATDGHKITTDETTAANIYNESGVAWYYILDTANQRFKLPRENPAREVLGQSAAVVGNGYSLGLSGANTCGLLYNPNSSIALDAGTNALGKANGTSVTVGGMTNKIQAVGVTTDPTKSNIIAKLSETTGVYKGKQYLYFYVGQYNQSATEQTAGLNSELFNGKVDLNAANLSTQGKSLISGLGMPSNRYIDLTLGATGSTYTAPANGYFCLIKIPNGNSQYSSLYCLKDGETTLSVGSHEYGVNGWGINGGGSDLLLPIKKGRICAVDYNAGGTTEYFRFIYAEGEPNV